MLNSLDYRYKYLLSLLLIIILIVTVGYLARKNHGKKIYGMSNAIKTDTTSSSKINQSRIDINSFGNNLRSIDLTRGLVELSISYSGNSNILVNVLNGDGSPIAKVIEHKGPCIRKRMIFVPETGQYYLDVKCDGKWTVSAN